MRLAGTLALPPAQRAGCTIARGKRSAAPGNVTLPPRALKGHFNPSFNRFFEVALQATTPLSPEPRAALCLPWAKVEPPLRGCGSAHSAEGKNAQLKKRRRAEYRLPPHSKFFRLTCGASGSVPHVAHSIKTVLVGFCICLTPQEAGNLKSQFATSSSHGGNRCKS